MTLVSRLLTVLIILFLVACSQEKVKVIEGSIYGTTYSVQFTKDVDKEKIKGLIEAELNRIDMIFSTYKEKSLISIINNNLNCVQDAVGLMTDQIDPWWIKQENSNWSKFCTSDEFDYLFYLSHQIKENSNGAFNPVALSENVDFYCPQSVCLDFSAIGKGYAVDKISELLVKLGITDYFVEIGGEISINGTKFGDSWTWAINNPFDFSSEAYRAFKAPEEGISIATSGEYRNPGHIWGYEVTLIHKGNIQKFMEGAFEGNGGKNVASVTVIADNTTEADAWATAMYVLGIEQGLKIANREGLSVFFIREDGKTMESLMWGLKTLSPEQLIEEIKEQI
tara:strand:- start:388 stop:1401 length:1014 start_codon:yes stop_codon:yes gene_type:complete